MMSMGLCWPRTEGDMRVHQHRADRAPQGEPKVYDHFYSGGNIHFKGGR